jgi:protein FAM50
MSEFKGSSKEGTRAASLLKKREKEQGLLRDRMEQLERETARATASFAEKFAVKADNLEEKLKATTYGLVTLEQMKAQREALEAERDRHQAQVEEIKVAAVVKKKVPPKITGAMSFSLDGDDEEEDEEDDGKPMKSKASADDEDDLRAKRKRFGKNPDVDTSFLPDQEREEAERQERDKIAAEIKARREAIKAEKVEITYSYWDGSGNRRQIEMKKGNTIAEFLSAALHDLRKDFPELRGVSSESLLYVKEDLLIPHHYSFYDFIVTKARGKSGPLFNFDVHDDVRLTQDITVEKDESHAGKVCFLNHDRVDNVIVRVLTISTDVSIGLSVGSAP